MADYDTIDSDARFDTYVEKCCETCPDCNGDGQIFTQCPQFPHCEDDCQSCREVVCSRCKGCGWVDFELEAANA